MTENIKFHIETDLSLKGGGEAPDVVNGLKCDLDGWREVLIPISAVLRWEQHYHPAILVASSTFFFVLIWLCDVSALTAVSLIFLVLGILDFSVPYFGSTITGYKVWTVEEEYKFTSICENIACFRSDLVDMWKGFVNLRQDNSKVFFIILMGALSFTAWIGNLVNNLFLSYIIVTLCLCVPGLQHNDVTRVYLKRGINTMIKLRTILMKPKEH